MSICAYFFSISNPLHGDNFGQSKINQPYISMVEIFFILYFVDEDYIIQLNISMNDI